MDFTHRIPAPRTRVLAGIADPAVLRPSLPGCTAVESEGADRYVARFGEAPALSWTLGRAEAPDGVSAEWARGEARGTARARFEEEGAFTLVRGSVEGVGPEAEAAVASFARAFGVQVAEPEPVAAGGLASAAVAATTRPGWLDRVPARPLGFPLAAWVGVPLFVLVAFVLFLG